MTGTRKIEYQLETECPFSKEYPKKICFQENRLFVPQPAYQRIICFDGRLARVEEPFFMGDQVAPIPFLYTAPVCIERSEFGFITCDTGNPRALCFDLLGRLQYARALPGLLEHTFAKAVTALVDGRQILIAEADGRLNLIDPAGRKRTVWAEPLLKRGAYRPETLVFRSGCIYLASGPGEILTIDVSRENLNHWFIEVKDDNGGQLTALGQDSSGKFYAAYSEPASLKVFSQDFSEIIAVYDQYGYMAGQIREPKCLTVAENGIIYLVDDDRLMKFQLIEETEEKDEPDAQPGEDDKGPKIIRPQADF